MSVIQDTKRDLVEMANEEGFGKIFMSGILGAAIGMAGTYSVGVSANKTEIVRLATQISSLNETIRADAKDRYTGRDAARDQALIHQVIQTIQKRNDETDSRLSDYIKGSGS